MTLTIGRAAIQYVSIIDDEESVRQGYEYAVEELGLSPLPEAGPLPTIQDTVRQIAARAQAAICDHHLATRNYAAFRGAEIVAQCYLATVPALLCTKWEDASLDEIRPFRRHIPVLLKPSELEPDSIRAGLIQCVEEFDGNLRPTRKAWRTLVRVEEVSPDTSQGFLFIVLPSWDPNEVIRLRCEALPAPIQEMARAGARLHVRANLGAEHHSELYFVDWEAE